MKTINYWTLLLLINIGACGSNKQFICYVNPNKLLQGYHVAMNQHGFFQVTAQGWQQRIDLFSSELQALSKVPAITRTAKEQQLFRYREAIQQQAQQ